MTEFTEEPCTNRYHLTAILLSSCAINMLGDILPRSQQAAPIYHHAGLRDQTCYLSRVAVVDSSSIVVGSCNAAETWIVSTETKEGRVLRPADDMDPSPEIENGQLHFKMSLLDVAYSPHDGRVYLLLATSSSYGIPTLEVFRKAVFEESLQLDAKFTGVDCDSTGVVFLYNPTEEPGMELLSWTTR